MDLVIQAQTPQTQAYNTYNLGNDNQTISNSTHKHRILKILA